MRRRKEADRMIQAPNKYATKYDDAVYDLAIQKLNQTIDRAICYRQPSFKLFMYQNTLVEPVLAIPITDRDELTPDMFAMFTEVFNDQRYLILTPGANNKVWFELHLSDYYLDTDTDTLVAMLQNYPLPVDYDIKFARQL